MLTSHEVSSIEHVMTAALSHREFHRLHDLQGRVLQELGELLQELETRVPLPHAAPGGERFEYQERSVQQLIVVLLARLLAALHAQRLLVGAGLVPDATCAARTVQDVAAKVAFACLPLCRDEPAALHEPFHRAFWGETPAPPHAGLAREIRAHLAAALHRVDPGTAELVSIIGEDVVVLPAADDARGIMRCCGTPGPRLHVAGLVGFPDWHAAHATLKQQVRQGICCFALAAIAFGHPGMHRFADDCRIDYQCAARPSSAGLPSAATAG